MTWGTRGYASRFFQNAIGAEGFFEKSGVQGGGEALLRDAVRGRVCFQKRQGQSAEQGQVLRGVPLLHAVAIFLEVYIELPMQVVLNPPVLPQPGAVVFRTG